MLTPQEAMSAVHSALRILPSETRPLSACAGAVLRETLRADRPQPPYDRVTMDGYALSGHVFARGMRTFAVADIQRAGDPPSRRRRIGDCIEVMTGSVLPHGCDTIVPVEDVRRDGDTIRIGVAEPGRFIHRAGSDVARGTVVLQPGARLDGPALGIAASVGRTALRVSRAPRVAIIGTGDEIVAPGARPLPHQIRPSNACALAASLRRRGWTELESLQLQDDPAQLTAEIGRVLRGCDLVVLTGGVSKGRFDFIPAVLAKLGVRKLVHGVAQQPGKPLWFGAKGRTLVFGLPGNPVSALVSLHRYVLPALDAAAGAGISPCLRVRLSARASGPRAFTLFRPVTLAQDASGCPVARLVPMQNSGDFFPLAGSDGFVEIPASFRPGRLVDFRPWSPR